MTGAQGEAGGPLIELIEQKEDYSYRSTRVSRAELRYRRSDGQMSETVTRIAVERGDAVGVLVYDPAAGEVVLVRQFRYPALARLDAQERAGEGARKAWLLEIVAGMQEEGQSAEETARRELHEETGLEATGALERIATFYTSPGFASEQVTVFLAEVDTQGEHGDGGGLASEGEDTELVRLALPEALAMAARGEIADAKTLIALQYLAQRQGLGARG